MKKNEVVVIGELNVDIILNNIHQLPEIGKEILADNLNLTLGSSSAILASNLSSLGEKVAFIGKIGNDKFASIILDVLEAKKVNISRIVVSNSLNTGATIVLNYDQDRANITFPGAMVDLTLNDIDWRYLSTASHLHFSSVFLQPAIKNDLPILFSRAKSAGLTTSLDPQWDPEEKWDINLRELLPNLNIFMPNMAEFKFITGASSLEDGIETIMKFAPNLTLIIKDSINGAFAWNGKEIIHQPAFLNNNVVDCIGAGDSFNAGFIRKFISGFSLKQCLEYAALVGAVSTTCTGGTGAFLNFEMANNLAKKHFNRVL